MPPLCYILSVSGSVLAIELLLSALSREIGEYRYD